eukprot:Gregarina_sp_Pseudo_9__1714@NODE_2162_length_1120_cov_324_975023_g1991_i0_p1_GENE_NODE_2162_length_1120_cov_324_975023_g1991_i0NODE_2162_length_1120_cov_324_975023_g1991_i0_p1_ORF_typecomplete_len318_score96_66Ribosomal_L5e/PF17144_4/2_4e73Ribosomal_L18_c/PF14204_6/6_8e03Ribosomal_L18_c/PF14204_6/3_3e28Ribosomal_L18p/PF00861_22/0_0065Ribosomal_L18p/PF00861_22/8_8e02Ribosomal_L18p/PF00861_22/6_3e02Linker_histone/PF00538_19/3_3Linker_histone/PF00538_19/1_4e02DUF1104/PF06518_11/0_16DUF1104/PF06518_
MAFVKATKTSAYYSRFQVKPRRRREGKTDYQARRNLCRQEKSKYNTPKYRFVVRFTNKRVICQIAYATLQGDIVVAAADSTELSRYGMPVGLTNYAAAYATGLLCARRCLKSLKLDEVCVGKAEADGEEYHIEEDETERKPFKAILDIGLVRTTTGNRVFGALKGAADGGIHIPHSNKRFPGFVRGEDGGEDSYNAEVHRNRIFAVHVAEYMKSMKEEEPEKYEAHFSRYIKAGIDAENLEAKIKALHEAIRANPEKVKPAKKPIVKAVRDGHYIKTVGKDGSEVKYLRPRKLTKAERAQRVRSKIEKLAEMAAADE